MKFERAVGELDVDHVDVTLLEHDTSRRLDRSGTGDGHRQTGGYDEGGRA
jgi:hypothetical protein